MDNILLQILFNGLIAGSIYSLVAAGFSLIYSTCKFIHFAHGGVIVLSAYALYWFFAVLGLNFYLSVVLAVIVSAVLGYLINKFVYRPFRNRKAGGSVLLIVGLALFIFCESLALMLFGADVKVLDFLSRAKGLDIIGAIATPLQIFIFFVSAILFAFLFLFMKKSKTGKAIRAVADNKDVAEIVGISAEKIYTRSFIIGSAIAGVAATLISLEQNIEPSMGMNLMIKGFTGAVIGGLGSVPGAILGSFLLGLVENFGVWFLSSGYKDAIAFIILFIFLLFRSEGILGKKKK